jgi:carotenoid cleavage dioxygenase
LLEQLAVLHSGQTVPGSGAVPFLYEFDLEDGSCRERQLDERTAEFPRMDDRRVGYPNRWGYAMVSERPVLSTGSSVILKYDREGGPSVAHDYGAGCVPNEPVFVPRSPDADEDDGFVLNVVYDARTKRSFLAVLDAKNLDKQPIAVAHLHGRVPVGFHGNFAPGVV